MKASFPKKVCVVLTSRAQYGRSKILLKTLKENPQIQLQIVVAGSALLAKYGDIITELEREGHHVDEKITMLVEGGSPVAMAKTTGLGLIEFTTAFENLKPDIILIRGDRYEMLAAAIAASYLNIVIAHIEGGDVSGTIDESVRHAITKLSHLHFPTNEDSEKRLIRMGEDPQHIFTIGSLDVEFLTKVDLGQTLSLENFRQKGLGSDFDLEKDFILVLQHPVTTEYGRGRQDFEQLIEAIESVTLQVVWFWPNIDAGNDEVTKALRVAREQKRLEHVHFFRSLSPDIFICLLDRAKCLVGNSSSGIKESSYLGVPVVNIGTRQQGRLRAGNVCDVSCSVTEIRKAVHEQLSQGRFASSDIYFREDASQTLVEHLLTSQVSIQKRFIDSKEKEF